MRNTKGAVGSHWKIILGLIAVLFIAYGYYGYFYVPNNASFGQGAVCPFGYEGAGIGGGGFGGGNTCAFSLYSLAIGAVLIIVLIAIVIMKNK